MKTQKIGLAMVLLLASCTAFAALPDADNVVKSFEIAGNATAMKLIEVAKKTAVAAVMLQWIISNWKDVFDPDIKATLAKAAGMVMWAGISISLIEHVDLLSIIFKKYIEFAGQLANVPSDIFTPGGIIKKGGELISAVHFGYLKSLVRNFDILDSSLIGVITILIIDLVLMLSFFFIAISLFVANVEFWMMFAVAPLAFALIPLQSLRDQGIAPGKAVIAFGFRIIILGLIVGIAHSLTTELVYAFQNGIPGDPDASILWRMFEYVAGLMGCAMMSLNAKSIAAAIASGSTALGGDDALRAGTTVAAAATAGAAVAAGAAVGGAKAIAGAADYLGGAANAAGSALGSYRDFAQSVLTEFGAGPGKDGLGITSASPGAIPFGAPVAPEPPKTPAGGGSTGGAVGAGRTPASAPAAGAADGGGAGIGGSGKANGEGFLDRASRHGARALDGASHDKGSVSVSVNLGADK